ncbi:MAG: hypothetical protein ACRD13_03950, partial [Terriglobales bacterium]
ALAAQAVAVARRLRLAPRRNGCRVSYQGSALTASPLLRRALRRALERRLPGATFQAPAGTPLEGALRLARAIAPSYSCPYAGGDACASAEAGLVRVRA